MKYKAGTRWDRRPNAAEEEKKHKEWFDDFMKKMEADPEIGRRLMRDAGIWDENNNLVEKYRDPEQS